MKNKLSLIALAIVCLSAKAGEWDYPAGNETVADQAAAKTYIETHYPDIGSIALRYQSQSKLGHQYNFNITVSGEYKAQRTIVVHTDSSGLVQRVFKSLEDTILRNNVATTAAELEVQRRLKSTTSPDVSSGTVVDVTVNIVDPDLRTMDKQPAPSSLWADVADYPNAPRYVERNVEVLSSAGKYYLSNARVKQVDAEYLEEQDPDTGVWSQSGSASFLAQEGIVEFAQLNDLKNLTFASNDFTQVMAFYHIDQSLQYLSSLGYSLFNEPVVFDARGLSNNNSSYFYGPKAAMFGTGGSPDAIDADVVIHELGHGIHYQIVPDWGYGHTGAIAEGFADYWAGSDSYRKLYKEGSDFEIDTVFNWDGYFGARVATRSLWNQRARYFEQSEYRAHESVGGEIGDELWSTPLFQTLKQGVLKYGEQAFDEVNTIVLESMYGLGRGMKMHDLVESMLHVSEELYPSREYTALLKNNFAAHDLIKAPFRVEVDKRYVDQSEPLEVRILSNGRQAKVTGKIAASIGAEQNVETEKFETYSNSLALPQSAMCGDSFTLDTAVSYQYDTNLQSQDWTASETLILGIPTLNQQTKVQNSVIPDASVADNGSFNKGFKSFNFIINDDNTVIGDDFGIYLNIKHSSLSDLEVVLVSPSGTRQTLMTNEAFSKSSRSMYWVAMHDEAAQAFSGQALAGTWRLEVTDYSQGDTGQLVEWAVGNVESYSCAQSTDNNNSDSGSGGGSVSWGLIFLVGLLFWRREHFKNSTI